MAAFNKIYQFVEDLAHGIHDLKTGTTHDYRVVLTNVAPVAASDAVLADIAQLANGNGYATDGLSIGAISGAQVGGVFKLVGASDPLWTALGGGMGPFRYAVLYNATPAVPLKPLIGYWDYGAVVNLLPGEMFRVDLDQLAGVFTVQ